MQKLFYSIIKSTALEALDLLLAKFVHKTASNARPIHQKGGKSIIKKKTLTKSLFETVFFRKLILNKI